MFGSVQSFRAFGSLRDRWASDGNWRESLVMDLVRAAVLVVVLVNVPLATRDFGTGARGIAVAVALGVSGVAYVIWMVAGRRPRLWLWSLVVMAVSGGVLAGLSPQTTAVAIGCVVTSTAGIRLATWLSISLTGLTVAVYLATGLAAGAPWQTLVGYSLALLGLWTFGLTRRAYLLRAEQAEATLAETRRARAAETQSAAMAERARIAREIHDVLAHSLAAVSVNLQAAEGLLGSLQPGESDRADLAKAIECVGRASALTKQGMAEARRAILALRDNNNRSPLPDQLAELAHDYSADGDVPVDFTVSGSPRAVGAEAGLTAYRTAQEALTNARKHAPGRPVRLCLEYAPAEIAVRAANPLPAERQASGELADAGAGYGLAGLRERAALGGGTLTAGPSDGEWLVQMRIPA